MRTLIFSGFVFVLLSVLLPDISSAALVPCEGAGCTTCDIVATANGVVSWLIGIMAVLCAVILAISGLRMVTAGGNTGQIESAKGMIWNALIGFIILLAAWLIVDTVLKLLLGGTQPNGAGAAAVIPGYGPWNEIRCSTSPQVPAAPAQTQPTGGITTGAGCPTCTAMPTSIPTNGNACAGSCVMRPEMAQALTAADLASQGLRVSEGYPPVANHAENCHRTATCVDVSFANTPTAAQVEASANTLRQQGLTPVYEVTTEARRQELLNAGATRVIVVPTINREHYSVYNCSIDRTPRACG